MDQYDIEMAYSNHHDCPNVRKGVRLLYRLMRAVNRQSDGWAYWAAPRRAIRQLVELLQTAGDLRHDTRGTITEAQLRKAVAPIKAMVTRETARQKKYGNTFAFDVDAALEETPTAPKDDRTIYVPAGKVSIGDQTVELRPGDIIEVVAKGGK